MPPLRCSPGRVRGAPAAPAFGGLWRRHARPPRRGALGLACAAALGWGLASAPVAALDFGPFSLHGFAKVEVNRASDVCKDNLCQREPLARRDFHWADELVQGSTYGGHTSHVTLLQPYLSAKFDLGRGFKLSGLLSQRWRDGREDFAGVWYDKSVALEHEDWGSLRIGAMTTRAWHMADYPFGSDVGLADAWASSGAGYGLLTRAVRLTSRPMDVAEGDLVLEATYDMGKSGFKRNKPEFLEVWAHYGRGDLSVNAMLQHSRNGPPSAFGHGPFTSLFYDATFDSALGGSSQGIAMVMARYRFTDRWEGLAGLRFNRWSGAYAKLLQSGANNPQGFDVWNFPFNVDWSQDLGGGVYKGHAARSTDVVMGVRHQFSPKWVLSAGLAHLGRARTDNPSDRGQRNSATYATAGASYDFGQGLKAYAHAGMVGYARRGLAPLSMPSHSAFTDIDSRLTRSGNWFGGGVVYTF